MKTEEAILALGALAQDDRLAAFQLLMRNGPNGLPSGEIASRLDVAPTRMSFHLSTLERAGLLEAKREGRHIRYSVKNDRMKSLLGFLVDECCGNNPAVCGFRAIGSEFLNKTEQGERDMSITIYHNPKCGTSRNTLEMIRKAGVEPEVIEYLKTPPTRSGLVDLIAKMDIPVRELLRQKGTPFDELGLGEEKWSDDQLIDFMMEHPILINRPIVVTGKGVRLCRPSEKVLDLLPENIGSFTKEDGEVVSSGSSDV